MRNGLIAGILMSMLLATAGCRTTQSPGTQIDDSWITTKVNAKLAADPDTKMTDVSVQTDEGVVTLTGRVEDDKARRAALQLARNTEGVRSVRDLLEVGSAR
jgi:osmotically-inducible protein OsmY